MSRKHPGLEVQSAVQRAFRDLTRKWDMSDMTVDTKTGNMLYPDGSIAYHKHPDGGWIENNMSGPRPARFLTNMITQEQLDRRQREINEHRKHHDIVAALRDSGEAISADRVAEGLARLEAEQASLDALRTRQAAQQQAVRARMDAEPREQLRALSVALATSKGHVRDAARAVRDAIASLALALEQHGAAIAEAAEDLRAAGLPMQDPATGAEFRSGYAGPESVRVLGHPYRAPRDPEAILAELMGALGGRLPWPRNRDVGVQGLIGTIEPVFDAQRAYEIERARTQRTHRFKDEVHREWMVDEGSGAVPEYKWKQNQQLEAQRRERERAERLGRFIPPEQGIFS
jgi:hypothetical protein